MSEVETKAPEEVKVPVTEVVEPPYKPLAVVVPAGRQALPIYATNTEEVRAMANIFAAGGDVAVPSSYIVGGTPNKSLIAIGIMKGQSVGFDPVTSLQWIMPVNGRFSVWGDGAVAILHARKALKLEPEVVWSMGGKNFGRHPPTAGILRANYPDDLTCTVRLTRSDGQVYEGRFSVQDARTANLWSDSRKKPWQEYPTRMIFNRARAFAIRDGFANYLNGLFIAEEAQDMPPVAPQEAVADTTALRGTVALTTDQQSTETADVRSEGLQPQLQPEQNATTTEVVHNETTADANPSGDQPRSDAGSGGGGGDDMVSKPVETIGETEKRLLKALLQTETEDDINNWIAANAETLDLWRTDDAERYKRVVDQVEARREAKRK